MDKPNKYICECKGVTKVEIYRAIRKSGADKITDIQILTKATTGCGRCKPMVESILSKELTKSRVKGLQLRLNL